MLIFRSSLMCRKSVTEPMAVDRVGRRALHACSSTESAPEGQCGRVLNDWSEVFLGLIVDFLLCFIVNNFRFNFLMGS